MAAANSTINVAILVLYLVVASWKTYAYHDGYHDPAWFSSDDNIIGRDQTSHSSNGVCQNAATKLETILAENIPIEVVLKYPNLVSDIMNNFQQEFGLFARSDSSVAFSAETTSDRSVGVEGTIIFDKNITNLGNHFVPQTGLFQCPDDDWYFAMWSLQAPYGRVGASLVVNGEVKKYGPLTTEIPDRPSGTSSMASLLKCSVGDYVWVRAESWLDEDECYSTQSVFSSFTMFKIFTENSLHDDDGVAVALTVELSENTTVPEGIVHFDSVLFDVGGNYNSSTGQVICHEDGILVFVFGGHVVSGTTRFNLYHNDLNLRGPNLRNPWPEVDDSGTGTMTRLIQCEQGDVITIHTSNSQEFFGYLTHLSAFSLPSEDLVAFSATLSSSININDGYTIPFDEVPINEGNRFTPVHGFFGCLDDSYYVFTWSIALGDESDQRFITARLMMANDEVKLGPQTSTPYSSATAYPLASTQVVIQCQPATSVYLQAVIIGSDNQYLDYRYTDFSGFRLASANNSVN